MKNEFTPYDRALKLKELGFNEPCLTFFTAKGIIYKSLDFNGLRLDRLYHNECLAPTFSQAFRWFREEYEYCSYIKEVTKGSYRFYIEKFDEKFFNSDIIKTYEEAELACLDKLIEIVESKNK